MYQKQQDLKEWIVGMFHKENAHASIENALKDIPSEYLGMIPKGLPYSIWQLAEHINIAQKDIIAFSKNRQHKSPHWPEEYWPSDNTPEREEWERCVAEIKNSKEELILMVRDVDTDLLAPFPDGDGQNLLREALLVLDHNSYHTGQIVLIRKLLDIWN